MLQRSEQISGISTAQLKSVSGSPTEEAYREWLLAYECFNSRLFKGLLPSVVLTLTRSPRTLGFFAANRFSNAEGVAAHEISLNPQYLEPRGDYDALSTLVHEQCHLFRYEFGPRNRKGKAGTRGYHDKAWGRVMLGVGLVPSDTGLPGGRQTGTSVSHYVLPGGPFDLACRELLISGFRINWRGSIDRATATDLVTGMAGESGEPSSTPATGRARFICPTCEVKAWARPAAKLGCLTCQVPLRLA